VVPGEVKVVRVVDVRINQGVLRRLASKIHPFSCVGDLKPTTRGKCSGSELNESEEEFYCFETN
jgi:hypothetical protein